MQFDIIAESSYRSFLQYYQAALSNHLSKTPIYVHTFFIFQFTLVLLYMCVFPDKIPKNLVSTRFLFYIVFSVQYFL